MVFSNFLKNYLKSHLTIFSDIFDNFWSNYGQKLLCSFFSRTINVKIQFFKIMSNFNFTKSVFGLQTIFMLFLENYGIFLVQCFLVFDVWYFEFVCINRSNFRKLINIKLNKMNFLSWIFIILSLSSLISSLKEYKEFSYHSQLCKHEIYRNCCFNKIDCEKKKSNSNK